MFGIEKGAAVKIVRGSANYMLFAINTESIGYGFSAFAEEYNINGVLVAWAARKSTLMALCRDNEWIITK